MHACVFSIFSAAFVVYHMYIMRIDLTGLIHESSKLTSRDQITDLTSCTPMFSVMFKGRELFCVDTK